MGDGAKKLEAFKTRVKANHVVNFFKSPQELHAQVINTLSQPQYRQPDLTAFHYISDIPEPPEPYIAHPYTLLQAQTLIGRQQELNLLTDWVARPGSALYQARILSVVAIGGMGKSALTWKWFHDIAPNEMHPLAGRLWWSFYESDASFDNFVMRGVTWSGLGNEVRHGIYESLSSHFEALPMIREKEVERLEDLTSAIELYNTLVGLGRYDDAYDLYSERLGRALHYHLGANRQIIELIAMLFPDGLDQLPRLSTPNDQSFVLHIRAQSEVKNGLLGQALEHFRRSLEIDEEAADEKNMAITLYQLSEDLRFLGALYDSEVAARRTIYFARRMKDQWEEAYGLDYLGITLAARGVQLESAQALDRSLALNQLYSSQYWPYDDKALRALWIGTYHESERWATQAMTFAQQGRYERGIICAARLQGEAALGLDKLAMAEECLHQALARAREVKLVEEELPALIALAELRRRQGDLNAARELLDDVWEPAERGPYRLYLADACNVLSQVEYDVGNHAGAVEAATKAYQLAWCDGPPFAYHWGLEKAKAHLAAPGAPEPEMPPFDASKYEPMPEVEIVPADEEDGDEE